MSLKRELEDYCVSQLQTLAEFRRYIDEMAAKPETAFAAGKMSVIHDQLVRSVVKIAMGCGALTHDRII